MEVTQQHWQVGGVAPEVCCGCLAGCPLLNVRTRIRAAPRDGVLLVSQLEFAARDPPTAPEARSCTSPPLRSPAGLIPRLKPTSLMPLSRSGTCAHGIGGHHRDAVEGHIVAMQGFIAMDGSRARCRWASWMSSGPTDAHHNLVRRKQSHHASLINVALVCTCWVKSSPWALNWKAAMKIPPSLRRTNWWAGLVHRHAKPVGPGIGAFQNPLHQQGQQIQVKDPLLLPVRQEQYEQSRLHSEPGLHNHEADGHPRWVPDVGAEEAGQFEAAPLPQGATVAPAAVVGHCPRCCGYCSTCCRSCRCPTCLCKAVAEFLALAVAPLALGNQLTFDLRILKQAAPVGVPHRFDPGFDAVGFGRGSVLRKRCRLLASAVWQSTALEASSA